MSSVSSARNVLSSQARADTGISFRFGASSFYSVGRFDNGDEIAISDRNLKKETGD